MPGDKPIEISALKYSSLANPPDPIRISKQSQPSSDEKLLSLYLNDRQFAPWKQVVEVFRRTIAAAVIKTLRRFGEANREHVDELIQDVYVRLCSDNYRIFRECRAEHPVQLFGLVQAVATTTTLDEYRAAIAKRRGGATNIVSLDGLPASARPEGDAHKDLDRDALICDIERHLDELVQKAGDAESGRRDRHIFRLYYLRGYTAKEIAAIPAFQLRERSMSFFAAYFCLLFTMNTLRF